MTEEKTILAINYYGRLHCAMEGQQKEIQYPGWHRNTNWKEFWSGESDEVSEGNRDVRGNIKWEIADKISMPKQCLIVISDFDAG